MLIPARPSPPLPSPQAMHEQLVNLCEAQDPRVVPHAAKVAAVLAEVLGHGKQLVAGPVGLRAAQLLHRLQGAVPGEWGLGVRDRGKAGCGGYGGAGEWWVGELLQQLQGAVRFAYWFLGSTMSPFLFPLQCQSPCQLPAADPEPSTDLLLAPCLHPAAEAITAATAAFTPKQQASYQAYMAGKVPE